jgi:hypothetical protein
MNPGNHYDNNHQKRLTDGAVGDGSGRRVRHNNALAYPIGSEKPLVDMITGWLRYADWHKSQYESGIGQDLLLGASWSKIGAELRGLLNGVAGRLDCGTLDGVIYGALTAEGFDPDTM